MTLDTTLQWVVNLRKPDTGHNPAVGSNIMFFFIVYILYIVYYNKLPYPKFTVRREFGIERVLYENISRCYMRSFRQPGSQGQLLATGSSP